MQRGGMRSAPSIDRFWRYCSIALPKMRTDAAVAQAQIDSETPAYVVTFGINSSEKQQTCTQKESLWRRQD